MIGGSCGGLSDTLIGGSAGGFFFKLGNKDFKFKEDAMLFRNRLNTATAGSK